MGRTSARGADRGRISRWAAALLVAALALPAACSGSSGPTTPGAPQQPVAVRALQLVPAGTPSVTVLDLAGTRERWGLGDVDGRTAPDDPRAVDLQRRWAQAGLGPSLLPYQQELQGWSVLDVDLEVDITPADGPPVRVFQLRSSLDMAAVTGALEADGMVRSGGSDDAQRWVSPSLGSGTYGRIFLTGVTVLPQDHLLVAAPDGAWSRPGAGASLADDPAVTTAVSGLPRADVLTVDAGARACTPVTALLGATGSRDQLERLQQQMAEVGTLPAVSAVAVALTGDTSAEIRTVQADADATRAAATARTRLLDTVESPTAKRPYRDLLGPATLTADGTVLRYQLSPPRPSVLLQLQQRRDVPWAFC